MAYTLGNKCAKNCCKRTIPVQLIVKDVVTCFFGTQCSCVFIVFVISMSVFNVYDFYDNFCRAMRCISAAYVGMRCLSVCPSVTFVNCAKTNKVIFEIFSPSGSPAILVFPRQTESQYSDGNPPNRVVECRWDTQKNAILDEYLASLHTGLHCCQPYESRTVKNNKAATNGGER